MERKAPQKKRHTGLVIAVVALIVVVCAVITAVVWVSHHPIAPTSSDEVSVTQPLDTDKQQGVPDGDGNSANQGSPTDSSAVQNDSDDSTSGSGTDQQDSDNPLNNTANLPAVDNKLNVLILTPDDELTVADGTFSVDVQVAQVVSGTCTLTVGDYTTTAELHADPQSSHCQGFQNVPASGFSGQSFTVTATSSDGKLSGSASGTIK
jgi:cytoskeletal protein RodZ